jgi:hypothetical protein
MDIEDVVLVATVREGVRGRNLQVDAAEIPCRVEAVQAGKLVRMDSFDKPYSYPTEWSCWSRTVFIARVPETNLKRQ